MLAYGEDVGVVEGDVRALRLGDVEIVALSVGCWVQRQERVRRISASVRDRKTQGEGMRVELVGVLPTVSAVQINLSQTAYHETARSSVDLEHTMTLITRQHCLDSISFLASHPFSLR